MELSPFSGEEYLARFEDPAQREVGVSGTLLSIAYAAHGITIALEVDAEFAGAVAALDRSAAAEVALRAGQWFGDAMTEAEVAALLRPSLAEEDLVLEVGSTVADRATVFVRGREGTLADARALGVPRRVTALVRQVGLRISATFARSQWELASVDLTPTVAAHVPPAGAVPSETEPPECVCLELEADISQRAERHLAACQVAALRQIRDAQEVVAIAGGLGVVRGTAEWRARIAELATLLPPPPPEEDESF